MLVGVFFNLNTVFIVIYHHLSPKRIGFLALFCKTGSSFAVPVSLGSQNKRNDWTNFA